jgi:hypothetical protein
VDDRKQSPKNCVTQFCDAFDHEDAINGPENTRSAALLCQDVLIRACLRDQNALPSSTGLRAGEHKLFEKIAAGNWQLAFSQTGWTAPQRLGQTHAKLGYLGMKWGGVGAADIRKGKTLPLINADDADLRKANGSKPTPIWDTLG